MSLHPLIELSNEREVRQAKGYRAAAAELNGESLEALYKVEASNAPHRHAEDKKHLGQKNVRKPTGPQNGKEDRHLAWAAAAYAAAGGDVPELPDGRELHVLDALVPLRTAAPDKDKGDADPNKGIEDIALLGLLPDDRAAVVSLKYLAPDATRSGAGDTPLRHLLNGLAQAAMVDANQKEFREEIEAATGRKTSEEAPALIIAASPRYWELCRKREAQKGAGWIREMERLGREIAEQIGVEVIFAAWDLDGDPPWEYTDDGPLVSSPYGFTAPWEQGAGKLKPKPRSKKNSNAVTLVEADLERAPRDYRIFDSYEPGDRINHTKLGAGVVQGVAGRNKISVLFGDELRMLVHERAART